MIIVVAVAIVVCSHSDSSPALFTNLTETQLQSLLIFAYCNAIFAYSWSVKVTRKAMTRGSQELELTSTVQVKNVLELYELIHILQSSEFMNERNVT